MRKILLASVIACIPLMGFAATPSSSFSKENIVASDTNWGVVNASVNNVQACLLIQTFTNETGMISILDLADSSSFGITIVDNNWGVKSTDLIKIQIDDNSTYAVMPLVQDKTSFGFIIPNNELSDFIKAFASGKNMKITDGKKVFNIPLTDTQKSILALMNCDEKYIEPLIPAQAPTQPSQIIPQSDSGKIQI